MKKLFIIALSVMVLSACKHNHDHEGHDHHQHHGHDHHEHSKIENPSTPAEKLTNEVQDLHDVAMAEMGKIRALRGELKTLKKDRLDDAEATAIIDQQILDLTNADEGMMKWMAEYSDKTLPQLEAASEDSVLILLEAEKVKVTKVKDDILGSIKAAQTLLKEK